MSSTFNDPAILADWKDNGRWPAIHGKIAYAASEFMKSSRILDLCCSFGLLGERLHKHHPLHPFVVGVDCDVKAMRAGKEAGICVPMFSVRITRETVQDLFLIIDTHKITGIVARRAFPELFSDDHEFGREFAINCRAHGITEILLEGRVESKRSSNSLCGVDLEVQLLAGLYYQTAGYDKCAYLQPVKASS